MNLWQPLGNNYWCRLVVAEDCTPGGILLPDSAQENHSDALVLDAGPGRLNGDGARDDLQAVQGDRLVFAKHAFRSLVDDEREGFVKDEDLVAVLQASEGYAELYPANDYVLIEADPFLRQQETDSGIVVAANTLRGGLSRWLERGEELHRKLNAEVARYPQREQLSRMDRMFRSLSLDDQEAVRESSKRGGNTNYRNYHVPSSAEAPRRGRVVRGGPQARTALCAIVSGAWEMAAEGSVPTNVFVHWDRSHEKISVGGNRICIRSKYLCAVEA